MKAFFNVKDVNEVLALRDAFPATEAETVPIAEAAGRILAEDIAADADLPGFRRSTMDGYAVRAASSFGASEGSPAYLNIRGTVRMGESPDFAVGPGEAARISTGGMLPEGADAVVMIEHTDALDDTSVEVYKSAAPGQHVVEADEDFAEGETPLRAGDRLRAPEIGLLAAFGYEDVRVHRRPVVSILSTGDEVVPVGSSPRPGEIRDINSYTLAALVRESGGNPVLRGIIADDDASLFRACSEAAKTSDMVLISGGSSVGARDCTIEVLSRLPDAEILAHGISISPGKPTILARAGTMPFWGLPGHVVSAMVVFTAVVRPFIERISGRSDENREKVRIPAKLSRNLASAQGRVDYVRVRLQTREDGIWAEPIPGKSGLIHTMVEADGLIAVDRDTEGLDRGETVRVMRI